MSNVKEYLVESFDNYQDLQQAVNFNLSNLWQPIGGVSITSYIVNGKTVIAYAQAMVKY